MYFRKKNYIWFSSRSERLKNLYKKSRKGDKIGNILTKNNHLGNVK